MALIELIKIISIKIIPGESLFVIFSQCDENIYDNYIMFYLNRWNNPVLDRLTGGMGNAIYSVIPPNRNIDNRQQQKTSLAAHGLRNESYYMATQEAWSPKINVNNHGNNSVLIEEDIEPQSP